jgi:excinuclease ABC subunit C
VGVRVFDRKFGQGFLEGLPASPAVYLFRDEDDRVLYVGKAKDVRRRLSSYRRANRRKAHRKMRTLVREASSVEVRPQESDRAALLVENALIRELRPPYNVDGAYSFLYPAIGVRGCEGQALLCFTTDVDAWEGLGFHWYGSFRSRLRAKEAFDALVDLLILLGHREPRSHLSELPRVRGSRVVGIRRLGPARLSSVQGFLAGESREALGRLCLDLLEKPRARHDAVEVQAALDCLAAFYESDIETLRRALERVGRAPTFVPQDERDSLFIESRYV